MASGSVESSVVLNVQTASETELKNLKGIGPVKAHRLVSLRNQKGKLLLSDLEEITGISVADWQKWEKKGIVILGVMKEKDEGSKVGDEKKEEIVNWEEKYRKLMERVKVQNEMISNLRDEVEEAGEKIEFLSSELEMNDAKVKKLEVENPEMAIDYKKLKQERNALENEKNALEDEKSVLENEKKSHKFDQRDSIISANGK
ncbi:uncharacterized protein LOC106182043 [Lingula anatina]|uniref:Uncharacterized protein LOC106182043 n=1 Tax=Lingula anatina TaxID=7574 RepID=A0A1S3KHZ9_LINAN|nr:uncharacterized protein LOC106182043 [Lingula anatina]|eukprot:XP_013422122.1 uncharacterized protein LOC106182043 [Lingula anatina]